MADDLFNTEELLRQEAAEIHGVEIPADVTGVALNHTLNRLDRAALCISGGGIRSATFALGVIQALAANPKEDGGGKPGAERALLGRFHYLSTVSGGGYIGSWLSAWLSRQPFDEVLPQLAGRPDGPDVEPTPIENLRRDSNYLTPKVGLASADTWAAGSIVVRNLVLIWLLVLSALSFVLLALKLSLVALTDVAATGALAHEQWVRMALLGGGSALLVLGQRYTLTNYAHPGGGGDQTSFIRWDMALAASGAAVLTAWAILPVRGLANDGLEAWLVVPGGVALFLLSWLLSLPMLVKDDSTANLALRALRWALAGLVWGFVVYGGVRLLVSIDYPPLRLLALAVLGPPWVLMAQITAETAYVALTSGESRSDPQREWFARSAGWFVAAGIGWTLVTALSLLGSRLMDQALTGSEVVYQWLTGGGIVASALMGLLAGGDKEKDGNAPPSTAAKIMSIVQIAGGQIFLALVLIILSGVLDIVVLGGSLLDLLLGPVRPTASEPVGLALLLFGPGARAEPVDGLLLRLFVATVAGLAVAWFISRVVNINRFSLHDLYRNRLVRAYLGASHRDRRPNRFTGFDTEDNPAIHNIWPPNGAGVPGDPSRRLFHVVNCTLNVVSSSDTAWQQRKAMAFVVTPLHSGAADLRAVHNSQGWAKAWRGAYRPSQSYGGKTGISLGTAMAISGAAANPNMGYNSSPSVTLLFALFNVRLGWWLGNPGPAGRDTWMRNGPKQATLPWFQEAFGLTDADQPYVNLSDGGHFDNMGLYEMVRRRCRAIVLSDGGCDPNFTFEDLGNAVRKIYIDQGVSISFPDLDKLSPRIKAGGKPIVGPYCTVGRIHYAAADGEGEDGYILYVKPSYHGGEGAGIKAYANSNPAFPHDSTADQWFDETQFESYRSLGYEIVDQFLSKHGPKVSGAYRLWDVLRDLMPVNDEDVSALGHASGPPVAIEEATSDPPPTDDAAVA